MNVETCLDVPVIRPASPTDAGMLTELARRTFHAAFAGSCSEADMQLYMDQSFTREQLSSELLDPQSSFLVAEIAGEPAGYAKLYRDNYPPECISGKAPVELVRLYVEPGRIGSGVGAKLMQACLAEARSAGHRTIYLGVWEWNHRAQKFYQKWGFERVGEHVFMMGNDPQTDWWMERAL